MNKKKTITLSLIIVFSLIVLGVVIFLIINGSKSNKDLYIGEWECTKDVKLSINDNDFDMKYSNGEISGTYELQSTEEENNETSYMINLKASKRVINGETNTDSYTTQFEFKFDNNDKNTLVLMNTVSYSIYMCTRNK